MASFDELLADLVAHLNPAPAAHAQSAPEPQPPVNALMGAMPAAGGAPSPQGAPPRNALLAASEPQETGFLPYTAQLFGSRYGLADDPRQSPGGQLFRQNNPGWAQAAEVAQYAPELMAGGVGGLVVRKAIPAAVRTVADAYRTRSSMRNADKWDKAVDDWMNNRISDNELRSIGRRVTRDPAFDPFSGSGGAATQSRTLPQPGAQSSPAPTAPPQSPSGPPGASTGPAPSPLQPQPTQGSGPLPGPASAPSSSIPPRFSSQRPNTSMRDNKFIDGRGRWRNTDGKYTERPETGADLQSGFEQMPSRNALLRNEQARAFEKMARDLKMRK